MSLPLAVLCGGLASRLLPRTQSLPKSMILIAGEPFIVHQLRLFASNGIASVVLCCGYLAEQIEDYVGDGARFGLRVQYCRDGKMQRGTGGALKQALPLLGEQFMVAYGDSYLDVDYQVVAGKFLQQDCPALMTVFRNDGRWDTSNVIFEDGVIVRYDKHHKQQDLTRSYHYIDYGLGVFRASVFQDINQQAFDLADVYRGLVDSGTLCGYEVFTRFYEIGSEVGIAETERFLKNSSIA